MGSKSKSSAESNVLKSFKRTIKSDPTWGSTAKVTALGKLVGGGIQPLSCVHDQFFPEPAGEAGMVRYIPSDPQCRDWTLGGRGAKCKDQCAAHSKRYFPAFVYTRPDLPECPHCVKDGKPTLFFRWEDPIDPNARLQACWGCHLHSRRICEAKHQLRSTGPSRLEDEDGSRQEDDDELAPTAADFESEEQEEEPRVRMSAREKGKDKADPVDPSTPTPAPPPKSSKRPRSARNTGAGASSSAITGAGASSPAITGAGASSPATTFKKQRTTHQSLFTPAQSLFIPDRPPTTPPVASTSNLAVPRYSQSPPERKYDESIGLPSHPFFDGNAIAAEIVTAGNWLTNKGQVMSNLLWSLGSGSQMIEAHSHLSTDVIKVELNKVNEENKRLNTSITMVERSAAEYYTKLQTAIRERDLAQASITDSTSILQVELAEAKAKATHFEERFLVQTAELVSSQQLLTTRDQELVDEKRRAQEALDALEAVKRDKDQVEADLVNCRADLATKSQELEAAMAVRAVEGLGEAPADVNMPEL